MSKGVKSCWQILRQRVRIFYKRVDLEFKFRPLTDAEKNW